jgi:signal transduction histidine kinase
VTDSGAPSLSEAYAEADAGVRLRHVRIALVLFLPLVSSFAVLDWLIYPELFGAMLRIRLAVGVLFIGILALTFTPLGRYIRAIGVVSAIVAGISISWMVAISEGAASPYYAGLNLILVVMSVLLPWTLRETAVVCAATIASYVAACAWHSPDLPALGKDLPVLANNLFFLVTTSIICMTASHYQSLRRFEEFRLRYELDRQNRQLESLDRQKTEFFANVSHELRTPLTLILAPVQELLGGGTPLADRIAGRLAVVRDNGLRLLKLVNDLLDVIRLEEGKQRLERKAIDVNGVLRGVADGMMHLADTKDIALEKAIPEDALVVRGDLRALEKIFVNLVNNAIKFTDAGGRVRVESDTEDDWAVIRVRDTGIGIPIDEQGSIFVRFHQVDGSTTRRYRGSGLGLALVKELTELMDGSVEVESTPGAGTTMGVRLPLARDARAEDVSGEIAEEDGIERLHRMAERRGGLTVEGPDLEASNQGAQIAGGRPRVLVVEDEPDMRRYLAEILQEQYQVSTARTGTEGLRMARERAPDLVVLDLMLPEMDGLEVCRRIRADSALRSQKIMLLTARVDEQSKITALEQGADDFLTKPFSSVEVRTRLRNLLATAILERDLEERNRRLQSALADLEATQAQLIHSEKLNALGSLAAGLLHEINNPLNYSLTALQLIREDPAVQDNELLNEVVGDIDEGMQRIRTIVSDLRAFAYPSEADKKTHFDFREVVETALRFTAHELRDIRVAPDVPAGLRVLGSRSHIAQVLVNLLANSAKAIGTLPDPGVGEIRISAAPAAGRLEVRVADNGVGMDAKTLQRAFDPFFTTREVGEGVGLGLSICHTIVSNHGGRLRARSQPGEGTELIFDLPLAAGGVD